MMNENTRERGSAAQLRFGWVAPAGMAGVLGVAGTAGAAISTADSGETVVRITASDGVNTGSVSFSNSDFVTFTPSFAVESIGASDPFANGGFFFSAQLLAPIDIESNGSTIATVDGFTVNSFAYDAVGDFATNGLPASNITWGGIVIQAGNTDTTITIDFGDLFFDENLGPAEADWNASVGVADINGGGAWINAENASGNIIDFTYENSLQPTPQLYAGFGSSQSGPGVQDGGQGGFLPVGAGVGSISTTASFTISAGDEASLGASYGVQVPTPGSAALAGFVALAAVRRRR